MSAPRSPSDPDRKWAQRIGQALENDVRLESLRAAGEDDELMQALLAYRAAVLRGSAAPAPETSERIWAGIEAEIEADAGERMSDAEPAVSTDGPAPDRQADGPQEERERSTRGPTSPLRRTRTAWRIAAAAMLVVAVGIATWWSLRGPQGTLVAGTQTAVVSYETARGAVVRLRPNSRLYRLDTYSDADAVRFRLEGEAWFDVPTRTVSAFEVEARGAVVRVLGTRFSVRTWSTDPEVFLAEGRVELRPSGGAPAVLQPGQRGIARADRITVDSARATDYTAWLHREITLDARPANEVAAELGHHFDVTVQLPDTVAVETLSGRLLLGSREQALRDFGVALGGRFVQGGEDRFVFRAGDAGGS